MCEGAYVWKGSVLEALLTFIIILYIILLDYHDWVVYMDYTTRLAAIADAHGGIIEAKTAAQHGISKAMLYRLCKEDKLYRIVKGRI